jgi:selenocysteine lyase/cysteine desulfurase
VVEAAAASGISLRGGCFCNPGATESAFGYDPGDLRRCLESTMDGFTLERFSDCMNGAPVGAVRASLGLASNEEDVDRLVKLLRQFGALDDTRSATPAAEVA